MVSVVSNEHDVLSDSTTLIEIKDLDISNFNDNTLIKGIILTKWPVQKTKAGQRLKIMLKAVDDDAQICVFIVGELADDCKDCHVGDVMLVNGASLEKLLVRTTCRYQLILDLEKKKPKIWIVKKKENKKSTKAVPSTSGIQTVTPATAQTKRSTDRRYQYSCLKDLKSGTTVNVYAVVKFVKPPQKTRGSDYMMLVSIVDETVNEDDKLKCVLFARDRESLPDVKNVGDIVRFHRLKITSYNGALQGNSGPGWSCLTFDAGAIHSKTPRSTTMSYTLTDADKERVQQLRVWRCGDATLSQDTSVRQTTFSSVAIGQYFDLVCQVLAVCPMATDTILFRVWDGSKTHIPVYKERLDELAHSKLMDDKLLLRQARGSIYDVKIFDNHTTEGSKVKPGDVIKMINLHAAKFRGNTDGDSEPKIEFCLHGGTHYGRSLTILPPESEEVEKIKLILDEFALDLDSYPDSFTDSIIGARIINVPYNYESITRGGIRDVQGHEQVHIENVHESDHVNIEIQEKLASPKRKSADGKVDENGPNIDGETVHKRMRTSMEAGSVDTPDQSSASDRMCMQVNASVITAHHHITPSNLPDVNGGYVPNKYRVRVQVIEFQPQADTVEDLLRLYCSKCHFLAPLPWREGKTPHIYVSDVPRYQCPKCLEKGLSDDSDSEYPLLEYIYALRFLVKDSKDWLVVQLWRNNAVNFFNGVEPTALLKDNSEFEHIMARLHYLVGGSSSNSLTQEVATIPWIECCIMSYSTSSGTCFQLFDTALCTDT